MSGPIVYVDHSDIREGKLDEVREGIPELVEFVEAHEPQLIAYGFYLNEEDGRLTVVAIHPDSESLEFHLETAGPAFRKFIELIKLRTIEVYGRPSNKVLDQLQQKAEMLGENGTVVVHEQHAGFARFASTTTLRSIP
jgi:quinol monooxygenase YgiN